MVVAYALISSHKQSTTVFWEGKHCGNRVFPELNSCISLINSVVKLTMGQLNPFSSIGQILFIYSNELCYK